MDRATQCDNTENLVLCPKTDTVTPDIPEVTDTPDATPKLLTEDRITSTTTNAENRPLL